ncbi:MAG: nucleoside phosphorylase [Planctomycetota bacterium]
MATKKQTKYKSAEQVRTAVGRQYHIGVAPGEVETSILMVGDPERARRTATRLEKITGQWAHREFVTISGVWQGMPVTILATGIGCDNTEIALVELTTLVKNATVIRAGTCGGLQDSLAIGDLVVTWGAVRLERTSLEYVPEGYPAVADPEVALALRASAKRLGYPFRFGMTATASGFYAAQGRSSPPFIARRPQLTQELAQVGVLNLEMETSTLLTLASLCGYRAGAVCTVFASRTRNEFVAPELKREYEDRAVLTALDALKSLAEQRL